MKREIFVDVGSSVQQAIDHVSSQGGGVVVLASGKHVLNSPVRLRNNIELRGESGAVLERTPSISTGISGYIGYGHYEVPVEDASGFEVGDGVHIQDDLSMGFYNTVAKIVAKRGNLLFIDRFLNHDYSALQNGLVTRVFSVVEGEDVENVTLRNLTLDGNSEETFAVNGCRAAGVFLIKSRNVMIEGVEVCNFKGDAISFQQCVDLHIKDCHIHDNTGGGLHPGSGSVRYVIENNKVINNGGCGLFYCLRTSHSICINNSFEGSGQQGISVGERDTDHLISGNRILSNQKQGVLFREIVREGGDRTLLESNVIGSNCKVEGEYEVEVSDDVADVHIYNNTIVPVKAKPFNVGKKGPVVHIFGNTVSGQPQNSLQISGSAARVKLERGSVPTLGPDAIEKEGAMHLNIPELWDWKGVIGYDGRE